MVFSLTAGNIHGLPYPLDLHFSPFSRIPRHAQRTESVAARVLAIKPDVAVFQEVWTDGDVERLTARFGAAGYTVHPPPDTRFPRAGGLCACAGGGWQVDSNCFEEYITNPPAASSDARSHKGVQIVKLRRGSDRLTVLNTHLQSQYPPKTYADVRRAQIERLTAVAAREAEPGVPLIAVGDFNTYPYPSDSEAYRAMATGPWMDLTKEARAACGCETNYDSTSPKKMEGWIDYVLAHRDEQVNILAEISLLRNRSIDNPYSDHHGLHATIAATMRNGALLSLAAAAAILARPATRREWLMAIGALIAR
jgi:endonuclease/exonuclease/phosphatase family metal-dependent hydrolase